MATMTSLESLKALHTELIALSEGKLDRLSSQIDAHVETFRSLLDKRVRNEESRRSLATGSQPSSAMYHLQPTLMTRYREV